MDEVRTSGSVFYRIADLSLISPQIRLVGEQECSLMEYSVAYDVTLGGFRNWWFPFIGLAFIAGSVQLARFRRSLPRRIPSFLPFVLVGISIFVTAFVTLGTIGGHIILVSALWNGRCDVVEGVISDFHPMPQNGHDEEWFIVGKQRFRYSDYLISAGFNNTASHGGPIRKGLQVRIHDLGDDIAKLEIANPIQPSEQAGRGDGDKQPN